MILVNSKLGFDATKKVPGEGGKRPGPPMFKMNDQVRRKKSAP